MAPLKSLVSHGLTKIPAKLPKNSLLVRKTIQRGPPLPQSTQSNLPIVHYGQHVYLYSHIQTNQVVYSLSRHLNNKASLDQLPYLGKKSVPSRLRKDLWTPLAMIYFPSPHAGLAAYRQLREFRRLHETTYDLADITETTGKHKGSLLPTKKRGKVLMNQKANSIADMAAVLLLQEQGPTEERVLNSERRMKRVENLRRLKGEDKVKKAPVDVLQEMGGVEGVMVRWADMLDGEYAETWPEAVMHDRLEKSRYTAAFPVMEEVGMEEGFEDFEGEQRDESKPPLVSTLPPEAQRAAVATA